MGMGVVGAGTFGVLKRNQEEIQRRAGRGIAITMVADLDVARAQSLVGEGVNVVECRGGGGIGQSGHARGGSFRGNRALALVNTA